MCDRSLSTQEEHWVAEKDELDLMDEAGDFTQQGMKLVCESVSGLAGVKMEEETSVPFIISSQQY